jgi:UDP-N-acetylglucosamine--N-acetylmuramyl-(pentapeptide) pyrophosphoryl-undecaprenol N-acetylglucosamine transferase
VTGPILLAAGGTGGHLFPAESLAAELKRRGLRVELVTDTRALTYGGSFPADAIHTISAATPTGGSLVSKARAALMLGRGTLEAFALLRRIKPACVVGFGGYPTVPPLVAARILRVHSVLQEQNAVIGRANRFLAQGVDAIATGFATLSGAGVSLLAKAKHTGNPVRPAVIAAAATPYPSFEDDKLRLLVTGGSQGARIMSDVVPAAIALLPRDVQARLVIVQQARGEDETRVRAAYDALGLLAEVAPFFKDLPGRIAAAHLVVARSGASTVSELAVIGRPAILVPFPFALDQDQAANAAQLKASGAVEVVPQAEFSPAWLAAALGRAAFDPEGLTRRAEAAKSAGIANAAERLADLVMRVAGLGAAEIIE